MLELRLSLNRCVLQVQGKCVSGGRVGGCAGLEFECKLKLKSYLTLNKNWNLE